MLHSTRCGARRKGPPALLAYLPQSGPEGPKWRGPGCFRAHSGRASPGRPGPCGTRWRWKCLFLGACHVERVLLVGDPTGLQTGDPDRLLQGLLQRQSDIGVVLEVLLRVLAALAQA